MAVLSAISLLDTEGISKGIKATSSTPIKDYTILTVSTEESRSSGYLSNHALSRLMHIAEAYGATIWIESDLANGGVYALIS